MLFLTLDSQPQCGRYRFMLYEVIILLDELSGALSDFSFKIYKK